MIRRVWGELTGFWHVVEPGTPVNASAKSLMEAITSMRHDAADQSLPNLPVANLSTLTRSARLVALCVDVMSDGLRRLRRESVAVRGSALRVRRIENFGSYWAEFGPGHVRAQL